MEKCPRSREDCASDGLMQGLDTFVCAGIHDGTTNIHAQDIFRFCFKTDDIDLLLDMDKIDIKHTLAVLTSTLAIECVR